MGRRGTPDDFDKCLKIYLDTFQKREKYSEMGTVSASMTASIVGYSTGVPFKMPDGRFAGYIGSCIDVTKGEKTRNTSRKYTESWS